MKTLIAIGTALCMAFSLSAAHNLDVEEAQAIEQQTVKQKERADHARFERAAHAICGGQNAGWNIDGITITCTTKRGFVTQKVSIQ
jgi:hypothetical protein